MSKKRKIKDWFKTVTEKFKEYIKSDTDHSLDYRFMIDHNIHVLLKYRQTVIIISTINIPSGYGIFRDFLADIEAIAKEFNKYVVVENIHNIHLKNSLMKRGYILSNEIGSLTLYYKFKSRKSRLIKSKKKLKSSEKMLTNNNNNNNKDGCWKGYERVPGTVQYAKGSCRKKSSDGRKKKKNNFI